MKLNREYSLGIISIVIGIVGLYLWHISFQATKEAEISRKITSALNLLPKCGFDPEKTNHVGNVLLQAQKAIDIDGNYDASTSLFNSLSGELYACKPGLQANTDLMLITMLLIFVIFGIITIIRVYKKQHKEGLKIAKIREKLQKSKYLKYIQMIFLTPVVTTALIPVIFVFVIPLLLLKIIELGIAVEIQSYVFYSIIVSTILNSFSLYYLKHSPLNALNKFNASYYILNYNVMRYAFPIQISLFILLMGILVAFPNVTLEFTSDQVVILVFSALYLMMAITISIFFFTVIQFNSNYDFIMAKANCMLFSKSKNELNKIKHLLQSIKYYDKFLRSNFKLSLNMKIDILSKFLTDQQVKNQLSTNFLNSFETNEIKPLEFILTELNLESKNILQTCSIREKVLIWSPIFVGILSVSFGIVQIIINR